VRREDRPEQIGEPVMVGRLAPEPRRVAGQQLADGPVEYLLDARGVMIGDLADYRVEVAEVGSAPPPPATGDGLAFACAPEIGRRAGSWLTSGAKYLGEVIRPSPALEKKPWTLRSSA
jgi:hypothetical protein